MIPSRRSFLTGLGATLITAPAIVRPSSLMPVKSFSPGIVPEYWMDGFTPISRTRFFYYNGTDVLAFQGETDAEWTTGVYADRVKRALEANSSHQWFVPRERLTG